MTNVILGLRDVGEDAVADGGTVTVDRNGLAEAASAEASAPASNLRDGNPYTRWQTGTTTPPAALPKLTRARLRIADASSSSRASQVGAVDFLGDAISDRGVIRLLADDRWVERPVLSLAASATLSSPATLATSADLTFRILYRLRPELLTGAAFTFVRLGTADGDATADWRLRMLATGAIVARVTRYSASTPVELTLAARGDTAKMREAWVVVSSNFATVYVDGAVVAGPTAVNAHSSQTNQTLVIGAGAAGGVDVVLVERWSVALSATQVAERSGRVDRPRAGGLSLRWDVSEGEGQALDAAASGTIADDTGSGYTGTIAGSATWALARNHLARVDSTPLPRWHNWRTRPATVFSGTDTEVQATSGAFGVTSLSWTWAFPMTIPVLPRYAGTIVRMLYPAANPANYEASVFTNTTGGVFINVRRQQSAATLTLTAGTALADGLEHYYVVRVDGTTATAAVYLDGATTPTSSGSCTAFVSASSLTCFIGGSPTTSIDATFRGDMLWWSELVDPAEAYAYRFKRHPGYLYQRALYLGYDFEETSGATIANTLGRATSASLAVTGTVGVTRTTVESGDPSGVWLSGRTSEYPRHMAIPFAADVACSAVLLEVYDQRASSPAALRLGDLRIWQTLRPSRGTREIDDSTQGEAVSWTELGVPVAGVGSSRRRKSVVFHGLTEAEAESIEHHMGRLGREGRDVLIVALDSSSGAVYRAHNAIRGIPDADSIKRRRTGTAYPYTVTVTVEQIAI